MMDGYDGDSISEQEWDCAEDQDLMEDIGDPSMDDDDDWSSMLDRMDLL